MLKVTVHRDKAAFKRWTKKLLVWDRQQYPLVTSPRGDDFWDRKWQFQTVKTSLSLEFL